MAVITINGPIGCGSVTIGQMVAQQLGWNFVDRLVFTEAARIIGTPVGALIAKEQRVERLRDRLGRFLHAMLERSAMSGMSAEPYFGRGIENLSQETYMEMLNETRELDDKVFIEATIKVVNDLYEGGKVVIIGRGANSILSGVPGTLHVGLLAPIGVRVQTFMDRENYDEAEARVYTEELERAREEFFRKFWKANPNDPALYHMMLNLGKMDPKTAADVIVHAAGDLVS